MDGWIQIYFKELTYALLRAGKSEIHRSESTRNSGVESVLRQTFFSSKKPQVLFIRPLNDWGKPTHIIKGNNPL